MGTYLDLLRTPGVLRITAAQLCARMPLGMLTLAILLHVQAVSGSYALAGGVVSMVSLGEAVVVPLTSRMSAWVGAARILVISAVVNGAGMTALVLAPARPPVLLVLGLLIGASVPPLMPVLRALYPRLAPAERLRALFALDTTLQEVIWIVGPVAATLIAATSSTSVSLGVCAAITVGGTLWFVATPQLKGLRTDRNTSPFGGVLLQRTVALAMVASFLLIASFTTLEIGIVAHFDGAGLLAGVALAVASVGSLLGGLVLGHRRLGVPGVVAALALVAVGTGLAGLSSELVPLLLAMFLSGVGFAPALAALYSMISESVQESAATEVFGWLNTGALVGGAAGTAIGGFLADQAGASGPFVAATLLAVGAAASPLVARIGGPVRGLSTRRDAP